MLFVLRTWKACFVAVVLFLKTLVSFGQQGLQPGFNALEYADLLQLDFKMMYDSLPFEQHIPT
jgi:hypothetical protein